MALCFVIPASLCFETAPDDVGGNTARTDEAETLGQNISFQRGLQIDGSSFLMSLLLADLQALMNLLSSEFGWVWDRTNTESTP